MNRGCYLGSATELQQLDDNTLVLGYFDYQEDKLVTEHFSFDGERTATFETTPPGGPFFSFDSTDPYRTGNAVVITMFASNPHRSSVGRLNLSNGELEWVGETRGVGGGTSADFIIRRCWDGEDHTISTVDPATGLARQFFNFPYSSEQSQPYILDAIVVASATSGPNVALLTGNGVRKSSVTGWNITGSTLSVYAEPESEPLWEYERTGDYQNSDGSLTSVKGLIVKAYGDDLLAFDALSGEIVWTKALAESIGSIAKSHTALDVVTYDAESEVLYVAGELAVAALEPSTGETLWTSPIGAWGNSARDINRLAGDLLAVTTTSGIHLLNVETGEQLQYIPNYIVTNFYNDVSIVADPEQDRLYVYDGTTLFCVSLESGT